MSEISDLQLFSSIIVNISKLFYNIYKDYRPLLHLILSLVIIYLFYRLGKWKRLTKFENTIKAINQYQDNIQKMSMVQKKRRSIIKMVRVIFGVLVFICVLFNFMIYAAEKQANSLLSIFGLSPIKQLNEKIAISGGSVIISIVISVLLTKLFHYLLLADKKHLTNLEQQQQPEMNQIMKFIGSKALQKIKHNQCKQEYQKIIKTESNSDGCSKCNHKNSEVNILKQKYQIYTQFIHGVFSFKWCDVCCFKKKTDQYQQSLSPTPQKPFSTQQQQVSYRISELYKRCQKLDKYFKSICCKNCSYNYWKQSKLNGKRFMNAKTDINHLLQTYHKKK